MLASGHWIGNPWVKRVSEEDERESWSMVGGAWLAGIICRLILAKINSLIGLEDLRKFGKLRQEALDDGLSSRLPQEWKSQ